MALTDEELKKRGLFAYPYSRGVLPNVDPRVQKLAADLRERFPDIRVTSGFRTPATNKRGARGSQHLVGKALDIDTSKLSDTDKQAVVDYARSSGARGMGTYDPTGRSMHFDFRSGAPAAWGPSFSHRSLPLTPSWFQRVAAEHRAGRPPRPPADIPNVQAAKAPAPQQTAAAPTRTAEAPPRPPMPIPAGGYAPPKGTPWKRGEFPEAPPRVVAASYAPTEASAVAKPEPPPTAATAVPPAAAPVTPASVVQDTFDKIIGGWSTDKPLFTTGDVASGLAAVAQTPDVAFPSVAPPPTSAPASAAIQPPSPGSRRPPAPAPRSHTAGSRGLGQDIPRILSHGPDGTQQEMLPRDYWSPSYFGKGAPARRPAPAPAPAPARTMTAGLSPLGHQDAKPPGSRGLFGLPLAETPTPPENAPAATARSWEGKPMGWDQPRGSQWASNPDLPLSPFADLGRPPEAPAFEYKPPVPSFGVVSSAHAADAPVPMMAAPIMPEPFSVPQAALNPNLTLSPFAPPKLDEWQWPAFNYGSFAFPSFGGGWE